MTGIFLQARINSKRLPCKALLPLDDGVMLQHVMRALKQVPVDLYVLVTDPVSAKKLAIVAEIEGFRLFKGPEDDVLIRYCQAARYYKNDRIIRATGDNPLVSPELARRILAIHGEKKADLSHFIGPPLGTGVEVIETKALFKAEALSVDHYEREHLTTYLYRHENVFTVIHEQCEDKINLPEAHVSIDTKKDYELMLAIFRDLYKKNPIETDELVNWLLHNRDKWDDKNTALQPGS